jgi:hypothetical protein
MGGCRRQYRSCLWGAKCLPNVLAPEASQNLLALLSYSDPSSIDTIDTQGPPIHLVPSDNGTTFWTFQRLVNSLYLNDTLPNLLRSYGPCIQPAAKSLCESNDAEAVIPDLHSNKSISRPSVILQFSGSRRSRCTGRLLQQWLN